MIVKVDIDPVPASRHQTGFIGRKCGACRRGTRRIEYYKQPYAGFKTKCRVALKKALPKGFKPLTVALTVRIIVTCRKPRTTKLDMPMPDWDNFAKAVCDAANKIIWLDDRQIKRGVLEKQWGSKGSIAMEVMPYAAK